MMCVLAIININGIVKIEKKMCIRKGCIPTMKKMVHLKLTGYVQGVGLRYSVYRMACNLNITGYAKNLYDGSVEIVAEGDEENIKELIYYIKNGLRWAQVDNVEEKWEDYKGEYSNFDIR
ncbi:acylphosphatase [Thermoanaerobacterium sp. RBIITD]|nr:acylphosphatase [Thermoanaerobacterium sp. RBIITD]